MKTKLKPIPTFKTEAAERKFWETHDSLDYVDWSTAVRARFPNLKLTTQSISLRLPLHMLERIKVEANSRDVPYQSLIKIWLDEKLTASQASRR
jgi:predicted DNA binding CopG/RHH family protein